MGQRNWQHSYILPIIFVSNSIDTNIHDLAGQNKCVPCQVPGSVPRGRLKSVHRSTSTGRLALASGEMEALPMASRALMALLASWSCPNSFAFYLEKSKIREVFFFSACYNDQVTSMRTLVRWCLSTSMNA